MAKRNPPIQKYVMSPAGGDPRKTWEFVVTLRELEAGIDEDGPKADVIFSRPNDRTVVFTPATSPEDATQVRSSRIGISALLRLIERKEREGLIRRL